MHVQHKISVLYLVWNHFSTITEVHNSLDDSIGKGRKSMRNVTLSKLDRTIDTLT